MEDMLYYSNLYEYYKCLLTDKQKEYFEDYYFNNLTVEEIAENFKVSKNAVSKTLIEVREKLDDLEDKLCLHHKYMHIKWILSEDEFKKIEEYL